MLLYTFGARLNTYIDSYISTPVTHLPLTHQAVDHPHVFKQRKKTLAVPYTFTARSHIAHPYQEYGFPALAPRPRAPLHAPSDRPPPHVSWGELTRPDKTEPRIHQVTGNASRGIMEDMPTDASLQKCRPDR